MALRIACTSAAYWTLAILTFSSQGASHDSDCELADSTEQETDRCLLQRLGSDARSRSKVDTNLIDTEESQVVEGLEGLSWTTNIGQAYHKCSGSRFEVDYTGTKSGMVVNNGLLLRKGKCVNHTASGTKPFSLTQSLSCSNEATGCHMWCAPVWHSYPDTLDWSAFDSRCKGWNGTFNSSDETCKKTGKVFTWARAEVPTKKNMVEMQFAITKGCDSWCAPLWVTLYDPSNWAKTFRWCFNRKDQWGDVCDKSEDVSQNTWIDRKFQFAEFMQKHGYSAKNFILELAVYSEAGPAEVLVNTINLQHVKEKAPAKPTNVTEEEEAKTCGHSLACGADHQCCRRGDSDVDAKCCPKSWSCCEDSCCPSYYACTITEFGHTCKPPTEEEEEASEKTELGDFCKL